ncbi:hypothetical protein N7456_002778 [Penicillium angulare]|uniref:Uncharacterized protein n=1 Tax=Penicillium angulare TaxID=116970 RepID=A0A9W9FTI7_9EURO|nr:hypothetical protein N7456_002778 [Penicillium angulare]
MGSDGLYYLQSFFYGDEVASACREAKSSFTTAASIHEKLAAIEQLASTHDHLAVYLDASVEEPPLVSSEPSQQPTVAQIMRSQRGGLRIQNHINACLLLMQSITLELIFKMPDTSEMPTVAAQRIEILQVELFKQSQDRADRILNTVPALLPNEAAVSPGWADSLRIMWPLRMIIRSPAFGIDAKQPAINALRRIAYEMGLLQAVGSFYGVDSSFK